MAGKIFPQIVDIVYSQGVDLFFYKRIILLPDGNGRTVEKFMIAVLAFNQCQLRLSAVRDVGRDPGDFSYLSGVIENGEGTIPDPAQGAIRPDDAVFKLHLLPAFLSFDGVQEHMTVF